MPDPQTAPDPQTTTARPRASMVSLLLLGLFAILLVNSAYLYLFDDATFFYLVNVGLHLGLGAVFGLAAIVWGIPYVKRAARNVSGRTRGFLVLCTAAWTVALVTAALLAYYGSTRPMAPLLYTHIVSCLVGLAALGGYLYALYEQYRTRSAEGFWWSRTRMAWLVGGILLPGLALMGVTQSRAATPVQNPKWAPESMEKESQDPRLAPSSIKIQGTEWMPAAFFTESTSKGCGDKGCHPDIYQQWFGSAHHNSSFNNQWYRKSIEYMQEVQVAAAVKEANPKTAEEKQAAVKAGLKRSQWCAGCHDPSILLTGRWQNDTIANQLDEAKKQFDSDPDKWERLHSGLGCMMCHAAVHVNGTMGQGALTVEYPALHKFADSPNPVMKKLVKYFTNLDPGPHRKVFLKPLHTDSTAEFCSSCHKVHLDVPVNSYRWIRGFNDYDAWQASGVSGQGARSFYYPPPTPAPQFKKCANCHMPLIKSDDKGNRDGKIHSHRFPGANTAIALANGDTAQLKATEDFLKNKVLSVDIFGLRRGGLIKKAPSAAVAPTQPRAASLMGGEESAGSGGVGVVLDGSKLTAPLGMATAALKRGESVGIDVVVRTRGMGHAFPGGTLDAFECWVEFKAVDNKGKVLMWSGQVADGGKGQVDKSAHFWRALLVDEKGNPINKRNAWSARAVVYANIIPPGAADTVHYRLKVPKDCGDQVTLTAKVNYRKFMYSFNQFSYAGRRDPHKPQDFTLDYDNGHWSFDADMSDVSGKVKEIPNLPVVTMCETTQTLPVTSGEAPPPAVVTPKESWERWNDYGIGLYRQRDFAGAARAFRNVLAARPDYGDGHVHLGQTLLDDGQVAAAREELEKAVHMAKIRTQQGKAYFHYARALFQSGKLQDAIDYFRKCSVLFPRDREVSNQLGLALIIKGDYAGAANSLRQTLSVDPEDITANYNLIKAYNGLRSQVEAERREMLRQNLAENVKQSRMAECDRRVKELSVDAQRAEKLYNRFRADEASGQHTAIFKRLNPWDNNEAQAVHEHS